MPRCGMGIIMTPAAAPSPARPSGSASGEIRPVQGIGLFEQGKGRELAPFQGAFRRVLPSGNKGLNDQSQLLGVPVGPGLDGLHPVHGSK